MTNFVLTGPAITSDGEIVTRQALVAALMALGHTVQSSVKPDTDVLVTSRTDTVKYHQAVLRGLETMSYAHLFTKVLHGNIPSGVGTPNPFTDLPQSKDMKGHLSLYDLDVL